MQADQRIHFGRVLLGRQAIAFYIVGGLAALAYVLLNSYLIGLETGIADWIVSGAVYAVFVPLVYLAHRLVSFRSAVPHGRAFSRYLVVQVLAVGVASLLSFIAFDLLALIPLVGSVAVIGLTSIFTYLMLRGWAFAAPAPDR